MEVPANATLVVSYIGYKTQNVKVGSQNTFAIKMESDNEVLDEVVVINYVIPTHLTTINIVFVLGKDGDLKLQYTKLGKWVIK